MRKLLWVFIVILLSTGAGTVWADDSEILRELEALKRKVQELEAKLSEQEARSDSVSAQKESHTPPPVRGEELEAIRKGEQETEGTPQPTAANESEGTPLRGEELKSIQETIKEKLGTLRIHGGAVGYYQGRNGVDIEGMDFKDANGAGFAADLELTFEPFKNGEFFMRAHAGEGDGADKDLSDNGALFANLNTIADDNVGDEGVSLLEAFYTQQFFENRFFISIGKTEQVVFIDDNAFANDEYTQFVGKPFVNNPVFDSEDEYAPLLALGVSPLKELTFTFLVQSSSRPRLEEDQQKSRYEDIFDTPFLAGQMTYSPEFCGLEGNYRVYGWGATYQHPNVAGEGTERGWGVGLSLDQRVHEKVGLFARLGYQNDEVYEVPWFWSVGSNLKGIIPCRGDDEIGLGVAGLKANDDLKHDGTEYHLEAYYRIALSEYFAITPDIQYVINPLGNDSNDDVVAGMVKGQFSF
ncbi:MAG: hypothetical protein GX433_16015 [Deltaproteobacteria bacterium]|nr:hypothetical protein [Deltaproteobacteria bacterium]